MKAHLIQLILIGTGAGLFLYEFLGGISCVDSIQYPTIEAYKAQLNQCTNSFHPHLALGILGLELACIGLVTLSNGPKK